MRERRIGLVEDVNGLNLYVMAPREDERNRLKVTLIRDNSSIA